MITFTGVSGSKYSGGGPFDNTSCLQDTSGVYVILGRNKDSENWNVIDVGESGGVKGRVESHPRANCWSGQGYKQLAVSPIYTPGRQQAGRMAIEQDLRDYYDPPCGKR
ncbi:MAG: hypothetical protein HS108_12315 [Planctomycetes bacterium]|jgi:hypothetical protein|nr:hypothetical protein [Planctomycetota bacterium]